MRPFFTYFGGKWRIAPTYPAPKHRTIVEPFAGSAGYSLRYASHDVVLVEKYPVLAEIWRFLTTAKPSEVMAIPLVEAVDDLPAWVCQAARDLVGFSLNDGTTAPRKVLTSGLRKLREREDSKRKFCGWTEARRARVAEQMPAIRHWRIIEGDYTAAPDIKATWFVDPPYIGRAGDNYVHGSSFVDFDSLARWCRSRRGQTIVCEAAGATWLPFHPHVNAKAFPSRQGGATATGEPRGHLDKRRQGGTATEPVPERHRAGGLA